MTYIGVYVGKKSVRNFGYHSQYQPETPLSSMVANNG